MSEVSAIAYRLEFPDALPVSARRDEIMCALRTHPVIVVCGETGSGKTTQLPKMALALGRGVANGGGLIGHTQPRRVAATSVAKRIAQELQTELGAVVGYKIRFQDRLQKGASIKLMTDGILLAETQRDPLLKAYDTLIIDEAHERSLNIDFLLGYLRQILPRRPDLKVVITSATIDAERFSQYFASARGPAPVLMVSGRMFAVDLRWRPFEERNDFDLNDAVAEAVDELWRGGAKGGDILVFMPGEREIRDCTHHLQKHLAHVPALRDAEILPLYARLSQAEQDRIFKPHGQRRIVIATNVAETSLTVPGIRYVIDSGLARVKRYSYRQKVEQLQLEPISQAAANQRSGRCGRVAEGIAIRLYDEADFNKRAPFTDPEILRSSLAGVILRMKQLGLGSVQDFAFIEPPKQRAIQDGYQLLGELGAIDEAQELTTVGKTLARWPLDPRVGRMLLAARERGALAEVLVIASALSVQDVRERPIDKQTQADQAHKPYDDEKSEFTGTLRLWQWLQTARGGHGKDGDQHRLSNRQYEQLLHEHYLNVRRVREWRDVYTQLHTVVAEHGWKLNELPAGYDALHLSLLSGLLGNVGCKNDSEDWYLGARGIKFWRHPGAHLSKKPGRWLMAAELVETTRLFGRGLAALEPHWLEQVGAHLLSKQVLDPRWEKKSGRVIALERATLYGLVVYSQRKIDYSQIDLAAARQVFIRQALVAGQLESRLPFLAANQRTMSEVLELEHKSRRQDVMVDDALIEAFYDAHLPQQVCDQRSLESWWEKTSREHPRLLHLSRQDLMRHAAEGITAQRFPPTVKLGGVDCAATYLHQPGDPKDGVTVTVPLFVLNQVSPEACEWLVPGLLAEKIQALLKTLHQKPRARLVPLSQTAAEFAETLSAPESFGRGGLTAALLPLIQAKTQLDIKLSDFKPDMLAAHLHIMLRVVDEHGRQLGTGRSLAALKAELGPQARGAFQALAAIKLQGLRGAHTAAQPRPESTLQARPVSVPTGSPPAKPANPKSPLTDAAQHHITWDFGQLPELMEISKGGQTLVGFPALVDRGDAVVIEVFDEPQVAAAKHRAGLRRLFALRLNDAVKYLEKNIPDLQKMAVAYMPLGTQEELRVQIIDLALERAFLLDPLPSDAASFETRISEGRGRLNLIAQEIARLATSVLSEYTAAARKIKDTKGAPEAAADCAQQLQRLMPKNFIVQTPWSALQHCARYLKAIVMRLDKVRAEPARDAVRMKELAQVESRYWRLVAQRKGQSDAAMLAYRWLLEELRVSLFAQELRTPQPVSVKRLDKAWEQLRD